MKNCKKCNKEFEPSKGLINYCSLECRNSRTWTDEDKKKKSIANSGKKLSEEHKKNISIGLRLMLADPEKLELYKKNFTRNPSNFYWSPERREKLSNSLKGRPVSIETRQLLSAKAKIRYERFPEQHPNRLCAGIKESFPEKMFREFLEINGLVGGIDFILQYKVNKYYIDVYLPKLNMGIEIDGEYWHRDKVKEQLRESIIQKEINLIRFSANDITKKLKTNEILELIKHAR